MGGRKGEREGGSRGVDEKGRKKKKKEGWEEESLAILLLTGREEVSNKVMVSHIA